MNYMNVFEFFCVCENGKVLLGDCICENVFEFMDFYVLDVEIE